MGEFRTNDCVLSAKRDTISWQLWQFWTLCISIQLPGPFTVVALSMFDLPSRTPTNAASWIHDASAIEQPRLMWNCRLTPCSFGRALCLITFSSLMRPIVLPTNLAETAIDPDRTNLPPSYNRRRRHASTLRGFTYPDHPPVELL